MGKAIRPRNEMRWDSEDGGNRRAPSRLVWSLIGSAATAAAFLIFRIGADPPPPGEPLDPLPEAAIGEWVAEDERYAGRVIFVQQDRLLLDRGPEGDPGGGSLVEARTWIEGETEVIRIEYRAPDGSELIELLFEPDGSMHLRNPEEVIWVKREPLLPVGESGSGEDGNAVDR